jgi:hypothetical protein
LDPDIRRAATRVHFDGQDHRALILGLPRFLRVFRLLLDEQGRAVTDRDQPGQSTLKEMIEGRNSSAVISQWEDSAMQLDVNGHVEATWRR